jgi:hypothetical protein
MASGVREGVRQAGRLRRRRNRIGEMESTDLLAAIAATDPVYSGTETPRIPY